MSSRTLAAVVVLLFSAVPTGAQQSLTLRFQDGLVTLRAQNAPVRTILAEWARLGGATIVNGDRVAGPPVTLELTAVPERQVLDIVLRNVAGYMIAPRRTGSAGASAFDRILILPTSVAPRNPPPPATAAGPRPMLPRPAVVAPPPEAGLEVPADISQVAQDSGDPDAQGIQPVTPGEPRVMRQPFVTRPPVPTGAGAELSPGPAEADDQPVPAQNGGVAPTPANPFGIPPGSSATPGIVSPAPRPQQPQQATPNRVQ